jgi:chorismate dehydratase
MKAEELDLALLPVAALVESPELQIVPGLAIGCDGPVRSVLVLHRVPLEKIRTVALDPESRSSNLLTRVLFARVWQPKSGGPDFVERSHALEEALRNVDAAVRIGDKALGDALPEGWIATDLGSAWKKWTSLPFVFAVWLASPGTVDRDIYQALHESRREGQRQLEAIVQDFALDRPEKVLLYRDYLTHSIRYRLGSPEVEALQRFFREAAALKLISSEPELTFAFGENSACGERKS